MPKGYKLRIGEYFDTSTELTDEEHEITEEYCSGPQEPGEGTELFINKSLWFDTTENVVKLYVGLANDGSRIWTATAKELPKFVLDPSSGELLGRIARQNVSSEYYSPAALAVELPQKSLEELLEEI